MLISVIIPVHDSVDSLTWCLDAVGASDYPHFECVVVRDGPIDGCPAIAASFPVRVVDLLEGPFGPAHARNCGAQMAHGEILFFLDADVIVQNDTLTKIADAFVQTPPPDAVFGSYDDSPAAENFVSQYKNLSHHFVHQQGYEEAVTFWSGCGAVRRAAFLHVGGFDAARYSRPSVEDIDLGYRLRRAGRTISLNKELQVKHLKRWTLGDMLKSDIFDRAIPWTMLILRDRRLPDDLNLRLSQRVSALLLFVTLAYLVLLAFFGPSFAVSWPVVLPPLLLMLLIILVNYRFYAFVARKRGLRFTVAVIPLHFFYYFYSLLAFGLAAALYSSHHSRCSAHASGTLDEVERAPVVTS
jgi:glycosyltransferase involved in cell wall biosynthesis